jgi:uncharacterized membrane protein YhaH (DUF805 family)
MSSRGCSRLDEVQQALALGHWPQACPAELRTHVERCSRCSDEVLLTNHFQLTRTETIKAARTEPPNLLWWRAELRRRNTALERAGRPLMAAQVFALLITLAAIAAVTAIHWNGLWDRLRDAQWTPSSLTAMLGDWGLAPLIIGFAALAMLGGLVVYLTAERQ